MSCVSGMNVNPDFKYFNHESKINAFDSDGNLVTAVMKLEYENSTCDNDGNSNMIVFNQEDEPTLCDIEGSSVTAIVSPKNENRVIEIDGNPNFKHFNRESKINAFHVDGNLATAVLKLEDESCTCDNDGYSNIVFNQKEEPNVCNVERNSVTTIMSPNNENCVSEMDGNLTTAVLKLEDENYAGDNDGYSNLVFNQKDEPNACDVEGDSVTAIVSPKNENCVVEMDGNPKLFSHNKLVQHYYEHKRKKYVCELCSKIFRRKTTFQDHCLSHTDEKPFSCHICFKSFKYYSMLWKHLKCDLCKKRLHEIKDSVIDRFVHVKKLHVCESCVVHFTNNNQSFTCNLCDEKFKSMDKLRSHSLYHSEKNKSNCHICFKSFKCKYSLSNHLKCELCGKTLCKIKSPDVDKLIHKNQLHVCESCVLKFKRNPPSYTCEICDEKFKYIADFNKHYLSHSKKSEFSCNTCLNKFKYMKSLKSHLKCKLCGKSCNNIKNPELYKIVCATKLHICEACLINCKDPMMLAKFSQV